MAAFEFFPKLRCHLDGVVTRFREVHRLSRPRLIVYGLQGLLGLSCVLSPTHPAWSLNDPNGPSGATPVRLRHRIAKGQTLAKLALLYHLPREAVVSANSRLDPHHIMIGSVVEIPAPVGGWRLYKTSPSDTLESVCLANNLETEVVRNLNSHLALEDIKSPLNAPYLQLPPESFDVNAPADPPTNLANQELPEGQVQSSTSTVPDRSKGEHQTINGEIGDSEPRSAKPENDVKTAPVESKSPAWIEVRLPDGTKAWAPRNILLGYSRAPQSAATVLATARRFAGVPYSWGGVTPNGVDCSGFVQQVFLMNGYQIPRLADDQFNACQAVTDDQALPGDLVFFTTYLPGPSHVGIYLGQRRFLHASSSRGVVESTLDEAYYKERFLGIRRIAPWANPAISNSASSESRAKTANITNSNP